MARLNTVTHAHKNPYKFKFRACLLPELWFVTLKHCLTLSLSPVPMVRTRSRGEKDGQQVLHHPSSAHVPSHPSGVDGHHYHHLHNPGMQEGGVSGPPPIPSRRGDDRYQTDPTGYYNLIIGVTYMLYIMWHTCTCNRKSIEKKVAIVSDMVSFIETSFLPLFLSSLSPPPISLSLIPSPPVSPPPTLSPQLSTWPLQIVWPLVPTLVN